MSILRAVKAPIQKAFTDILTAIGYPDVNVIFSHQNGLEPDKSYGVINILQISQIGGRNEATLLAPGEILEFITHHTISIQISFVGTESDSLAYDFRQNMENNRVAFEILQRADLGMASRGDVRRIPQNRESAWVEAYNMDFDFTFAVFTRQSYDWVEYVTINGELIRLEYK